jgi:antiphage defense system Thoeris ThsB-like protein
MKTVVFLSHWHEDGDEASWLAAELRHRLHSLEGVDIEVFATSTPAHRFEDFNPTGGALWQPLYEAWVEDLRAFLTEALDGAGAYLLLLTRSSMTRHSAWVRWEIRHATQRAKERGIAFIPCLLGVGYDALQSDAAGRSSEWQRLEVGKDDDGPHPEAEFQAIDLKAADGLTRLVEALEHSLRIQTD